MAKLLSTLRTELMSEFGLSESNSNTGTNAENVLEYINKAHETFINRRHWTFNTELYTIKKLADTNVNALFTTSAASIVLSDTSTWPATGKIWVEGDIIDFTANNGVDTLTVVTSTISRQHEAGENAVLLYEMPSDFAKPAEVRVDKTIYNPDDQRNDYEPKAKTFWQYHIVDLSGVYTIYLQFNRQSTSGIIYIKYARKPVDLTDTTPTTYYLDVPNPHYIDFVKYTVMGRLYRHLEENNKAIDYEGKADHQLKMACALDSRQHAGTRVPLRSRWDNPRQILYGGSFKSYNNHH